MSDGDGMDIRKAISVSFAVISIAAALVAMFYFYSKGKGPEEKLGQPGAKATEFAGTWVNKDTVRPQGITTVKIERKLTTIQIHVWSKCSPDDCYWGYRETHVSDCDDGVILVSWHNDSEDTEQEISLVPEGGLSVIAHTRYPVNPGKADREDIYILEKASL